MRIRAIIQARMGSERFPGKVMMPIGNRLVIDRVIERVDRARLEGRTVCAIPASEENDVLAKHIGKRAFVVRGPEDNVALRFAMALKRHPCDAFVRICADSPFVEPTVIREVADMMEKHRVDIVSTANPAGRNAECVRSRMFLAKLRYFDDYEKEHVTPWFYRNPVSVRYLRAGMGAPLVLDTPEDYERLKKLA